MPDDVTPAGVSFQVSLERARVHADELANKARDAAHPELAALCALTCAATSSAFTIAWASRLENSLTPAQFASAWGTLDACLDRLEIALRASGGMQQWPTTPGTTLVQYGGDSALAVAIQFSRAIRNGAAFALNSIPTWGTYPPAVANRIVSEPNTDPEIAEWRSRTIDELRTKTLPPVDKWSGWEMNRDAARLQSLINDEYRRLAISRMGDGALGSNENTVAKKAAVHSVTREEADKLAEEILATVGWPGSLREMAKKIADRSGKKCSHEWARQCPSVTPYLQRRPTPQLEQAGVDLAGIIGDDVDPAKKLAYDENRAEMLSALSESERLAVERMPPEVQRELANYWHDPDNMPEQRENLIRNTIDQLGDKSETERPKLTRRRGKV